jgi:hypothetical protein
MGSHRAVRLAADSRRSAGAQLGTLVAQGEVLEGELPPGAERGGECQLEEFEHRRMLCLCHGNRKGRKADGVLGSHTILE